MSKLRLAFLGPPQIFHPRLGEITLANRKALALLAYLAVRSASAHSRDSLLGLLWPELPTPDAQNNLRVTWSQLRHRMGDINSENPFLIGTRLNLRFNPNSDHWLDLSSFQTSLEAYRAHAHKEHQLCPECIEQLEKASRLARGEFLEGISLEGCPAFDEWLLVHRERLYLQITSILEKLVIFYEGAGKLTHAEGYVRRLLELDPLRERAHRQLMRLLSRSGRRSAALTQFETCRWLLADELGVAPAPETVALAEQIRGGAIGQPATPRHNLPPSKSRFIGRRRESSELQAQLTSQRGAMVTLTGPGGVGKTRLALQVAHELVNQFKHGIWLVELEALNEGSAVPAAVAKALKTAEEGDRSLLNTLSDFLHDKSLMLVLDNCEHLLEACAQLIERLRSNATGLVILATSRAPLHLEGERVMRLQPLSSPGTAHDEAPTPADALQYEAVQLFVDRATHALLSFKLTDKNAAAVTQICRHLDGIPLAIELAAARAIAMPVEAIAQRLDQRFRWLNARSYESLARHQTLRAMIDWSHDLLSEQEAVLFRRLAVFSGGWTLEAAEVVCYDEELCLDILAGLVNQSLVVFGYDATRKRYRMHETIRDYARRQLDASGEEPRVRAQHAHYYTQIVARAVKNAHGLSLQERLDQLEREHDNLRTAIAWMVEHDREAGLRLATDLGAELRFWELRGHYDEGRRWLQQLLEVTSDSISPARAKALLAAAALSSAIADFDYGQRCAAESQRIFEQLGDQQGELEARLVSMDLAAFQADQGDLESCLREAIVIAREINDKPGLAKSKWLLANILYDRGEFEQSIQHLVRSIALWREIGDMHELAATMNTLAAIMMEKGDYDEARELLQETEAINRDLGYSRGVALALHNLGEVAMHLGDFARARELNSKSLTIRRELGLPRGYAFSLENFALLAERQNQEALAVQLFAAAQALRKAVGAPLDPIAQNQYATIWNELRTQLGDVRYELEWSKGWAMRAEDAIKLALEQNRSPG